MWRLQLQIKPLSRICNLNKSTFYLLTNFLRKRTANYLNWIRLSRSTFCNAIPILADIYRQLGKILKPQKWKLKANTQNTSLITHWLYVDALVLVNRI